LISAFVSLTLSPALSAMLLKPHTHGAPKSVMGRVGARFTAGFNSGFDRTSSRYARTVGGVVRRRLVMWPVYAALLVGTVLISNQVPRGFIPTLDQGYAIVVIQLPDGAALGRTDDAIQKATEIVRETPGA